VLLQRARSAGRQPDVTWRYFSLAQVNSPDDGRHIWDEPAPPDRDLRGRDSFLAAEAARRQGRFDTFHLALLRQRHELRRPIDDPEALRAAAREAGLDLERFDRDRRDPAGLHAIARDHQHGVSEHGVFGTPTLVTPAGAAYVRVRPAPVDPAEAAALLDDLLRLVAERPCVLEVKRPTPGARST